MPEDISRIAFNPKKHYTSVHMQQGRVMVDDDWNDNEYIENEDRRRSRIEIIGSYGSPNQGFRISDAIINQQGLIDFVIQAGSIYLGGLRLEIEENEHFLEQKDWLQLNRELYKASGNERNDLVYLETWQQPVQAVEDSELLEVALGGPDTSVRLRTMRRIHIETLPEIDDCGDAWKYLIKKFNLNEENERTSNLKLTVSYIGGGNPEDLCTPLAAGGYLGAENQAIRVQIVDSDNFTWGFNNASKLYRVKILPDLETVKLITEPKDQEHWPVADQIAEILPCSAILPNGEKIAEIAGHLSKIKSSYNPVNQEIKLATALPAMNNNGEVEDSVFDFYMRMWDRGMDLSSSPKIPIPAINTSIPLGNTGLGISFSNGERITGDYWVIAARPKTPEEVVPWEFEKGGLTTNGIHRFYAPLAVIHWKADKSEGDVIHDCRKTFQPLTGLETCCTFSVGDGNHSKGDFNSLEDAVKNLPEKGGKICLLPGEHHANVLLEKCGNIEITGCGERTIVRPKNEEEYYNKPIFALNSSQNIHIKNMTLLAMHGAAIILKDSDDTNTPSHEIVIRDNQIIALTYAVFIEVNNDIRGNNDIYIAYNRIGMLDISGGKAAIFCKADRISIERNRIVVVPSPDPDNPDDPRRDDKPSRPVFDPCSKPQLFYSRGFNPVLFIKTTFAYVMSIAVLQKRILYKTMGGIQIGGSSEHIRIIENEIIGGWGNGITLGNLFENQSEINVNGGNVMTHGNISSSNEMIAVRHSTFLYDITIEENKISNMGQSGIGAATYLILRNLRESISVKELIIYRNIIVKCTQNIPPDILKEMHNMAGYGGIALSDCEDVVIQENRIEENGINHNNPVCGIFLMFAEKVDISNNRILNNGAQNQNTRENIPVGSRGGIVIKMSFAKFFNYLSNEEEPPLQDGIPALIMHDNIVIHPMGQALFIIAFGPVSVTGNQLTSQGSDYKINPTSMLAGTVFILNLGITKDLYWRLPPKFLYMANAAAVTNKTVQSSLPQAVAPDLSKILPGLIYLPSGTVLFADNQVTLDLREPEINFCFSSQLIAALDDVAFNNNQIVCTSLRDLVLTNTAIVGVSIRTNDNRFQDLQVLDRQINPAALYSLFSYGLMNTAIGNQSTHCLHVLGQLVPHEIFLKYSNVVIFKAICENDYMKLKSALNLPTAKLAAIKASVI